jgi:outer membrane protein assembly factor BamB
MSRYGSKKSYVLPGLACVLALAIVILGCGGGGAAVGTTNTTGGTGSNTTTGTSGYAASAWPSMHGGAQNLGRSNFVGGSGLLNWSRDIASGPLFPSVSTIVFGADGTIFCTADSTANNVTYFSVYDQQGTLKNTFTINGVNGNSQCSEPVVAANGTIYFSVWAAGYLYSMNPDGTERWKFPTGGTLYSPSIGSDGTIYTGGDKLYALNSNGTEKWSLSLSGGAKGPISFGSDGTLYATSGGSGLYAVRNGAIIWNVAEIGNCISASVAPNGTIYCGSAGSYLYSISSTGTINWKYKTLDGVYTNPAIGADGSIYFGSRDKNIYALKSDGTLKWKFTTGGNVKSSPVIDKDGVIYCGSEDKNLYAINPDGSLKWIYNAGAIIYSTPAIASDGSILIGTTAPGKLISLK